MLRRWGRCPKHTIGEKDRDRSSFPNVIDKDYVAGREAQASFWGIRLDDDLQEDEDEGQGPNNGDDAGNDDASE